MSTLREQMQADKITAMKTGNSLAKEVLSLVLGGIQTAEKSGKTSTVFTDDEIVRFLNTEIKKRRETAKVYADAGVVVRAERENEEAEFLTRYVPAQLTVEEIESIVDSVITETGSSNLGQVMGLVMKQVQGRADGGTVRGIVQSKL